MAGSPELTPDKATGYDDLAAAWDALAAASAFSVRRVARHESEPLLLAESAWTSRKPCVSLSAGVHGDEPAAPWALLSIARDGLLDERFAYRIWCCTNPAGYRRRTRENGGGIDINRSFSRDGRSAGTPEAATIERANEGVRFALSLDLHEDHEALGFYCYEPVVEGSAPLGGGVVQAMLDAGLPVQELRADFDLGYPDDAAHMRALERGRVMPDVAAEVAYFDGLPYSMYLLWTGTAHRTMTLEAPRARPWDERVAVLRVAVVAALTRLVQGRT